jgi:hypothetical protein
MKAAMLKTVGTSGQLTLGKKYSGKHFELVEQSSGDILLRPVRLVRDSPAPARTGSRRAPAFQIAEVENIVMPSRDQRNSRPK